MADYGWNTKGIGPLIVGIRRVLSQNEMRRKKIYQKEKPHRLDLTKDFDEIKYNKQYSIKEKCDEMEKFLIHIEENFDEKRIDIEHEHYIKDEKGKEKFGGYYYETYLDISPCTIFTEKGDLKITKYGYRVGENKSRTGYDTPETIIHPIEFPSYRIRLEKIIEKLGLNY